MSIDPVEEPKTLIERENEAVSMAVIGSLKALSIMAWDETLATSDRIEAASRILAYVSACGPDDDDDDDDDGGILIELGGPDPEGDEDEC